MSDAIVRVTEVTKEYPRSGTALRDVSFEMRKGEFAFLVGHSGAGKSTLLRLLTMADRPTRGELRVSEYSSASITSRDIPQLRRRLGIVFQDFRLLPDRTAEQNVAFALEVVGTPHAQIGARVARLLTQVGLASRATAFPHELSGGEQQRVAIARALANDPLLLLADEPTGNLDTANGLIVLDLLIKLNREERTTLVMVTHDKELATYADRVITLKDGLLVSDEKKAA
jgi:cell division transport system ATP-binding protein